MKTNYKPMLSKLQFMPRWLIFLIDLVLVMASVFFAFLFRFNFDLELVSVYNLRLAFAEVLLVNIVAFYFSRSYSGIIRHTSIEDAGRLLLLNITVSLALGMITFVSDHYVGMRNLPLSVIAIYFFVATMLMIAYRMLARFIFHAVLRPQSGNIVKAAVYCTTKEALLARKVLSDHFSDSMQIIAFIDEAGQNAGKVIEGTPIHRMSETSLERLKIQGLSLLVIADPQLDRGRLNEIVDLCLQYGIRVQQIPSADDWINGTIQGQKLKDINIEDLLERDTIVIDNSRIRSEIRGKKILVTGAAGSIGSELVRQLIGFEPAHIIICDKAESPMHELILELREKFPQYQSVHSYIGDICDRVRMEQLFDIYKPQMVYHAAAYKHVPLMEENPSVAVINNVLGTKILAELAVANEVEKFVMVSTDKAVNPTNVMGASKRIAEIFIQSYFRQLQKEAPDKTGPVTRFVTTRFGNVLGSNGSVIPRFKMQLENGGPITVTHPEITRYFMTIPEACQLVIEAGVMGQGGEIFVFDMGRPVKILDLARKMIRLAGKQPDVDIRIEFSGLRPGEKLYEELLNNSENTMPTYHEKIMIARVREQEFSKVSLRVETLILSARQHYTVETVRQMKQLVPEFLSKNSVYEKLDLRSAERGG